MTDDDKMLLYIYVVSVLIKILKTSLNCPLNICFIYLTYISPLVYIFRQQPLDVDHFYLLYVYVYGEMFLLAERHPPVMTIQDDDDKCLLIEEFLWRAI